MLPNIRVGLGYDSHRFVPDRKLIMGGVEIDYPMGLAGHSDADVLVHAIIDSLLGVSGLGDIGGLFPDKDPQFRDISSIILLGITNKLLKANSVSIINIDTVVICEEPRISRYADKMKINISEALGSLGTDRISIKGKTNEKMGFTGRGEGIEVQAVSLVAFL